MTFTATKLLSFEEYLAYEGDEDTRYELVDGQLEPGASQLCAKYKCLGSFL